MQNLIRKRFTYYEYYVNYKQKITYGKWFIVEHRICKTVPVQILVMRLISFIFLWHCTRVFINGRLKILSTKLHIAISRSLYLHDIQRVHYQSRTITERKPIIKSNKMFYNKIKLTTWNRTTSCPCHGHVKRLPVLLNWYC